jgi:3-oxoacyl-[acyl-carrier-protein] synthase II
MRRVVVTGIGVVSPLAGNVKNTWNKLISGKSGIRKTKKFDVSDLPAKIGGFVPSLEESDDGSTKKIYVA